MKGKQVAPDAAAQIDGMIFAVLLLDPEGCIAQANSAAEEMFGRSAHKLIGEHLLQVLRIENERVSASLERGEMQLIARSLSASMMGEARCINLTSSPLNSDPSWRLVTLSEASQDDAPGDVEENNELRAPAILAHEIKNPLSAIRGASQLLSRRLGERDKALTQLISTEVDRIASLIDRMQQLGAKSSVTNGPCNLHQAIRAAMAVMRASRTRDCELVEEFDPSLPAVAADEGALEQVLTNLISNACDACRDVEDAKVMVQTRYSSGSVFNAIRFGKATRLPIEITVTDPGPGIDPALQDRIFEPFVSTKPLGQGLGLALVRKLVRDMGGRIAYHRDERASLTHFRINLPLAG